MVLARAVLALADIRLNTEFGLPCEQNIKAAGAHTN